MKINRENTFNKKAISIKELDFECNVNEVFVDTIMDITIDGLLLNLDGLNDIDFINYINDYNLSCYKVYNDNISEGQLLYYAIEMII